MNSLRSRQKLKIELDSFPDDKNPHVVGLAQERLQSKGESATVSVLFLHFGRPSCCGIRNFATHRSRQPCDATAGCEGRDYCRGEMSRT